MEKFLNLEFDKEFYDNFKKNEIEYKREFNELWSKAYKKFKEPRCRYCGEEVESFCNSHSIPAFSLRNIASNGKLLTFNVLINNPFLATNKGVKNSGVFHMICNECDNNIFKEYEDTKNYDKEITTQMLSQIAMKNYLNSIYKTQTNIALSEECLTKGFNRSVTEEWYTKVICSLDLKEYNRLFEKSKKINSKSWGDEYHLVFYEKLDYVVPIAFQSRISPLFDLRGNQIEKLFSSNEKNIEKKFAIRDIHICIFPFSESSIVMMFIDSSLKNYRNFYKDFKKLSLSEKLSVINYLIFLYSEDIFISKEIDKEVLKNKNLINIAVQNSTYEGDNSSVNYKNIFDLNRRNEVPNLLDEKYKIIKK